MDAYWAKIKLQLWFAQEGFVMNETFAQKLSELNNDFYRSQSTSFSDTRKAKWLGWERCLAEMGKYSEGAFSGTNNSGRETLSVLDVACGNLRFEEFLATSLPTTTLKVVALDSCDDLVSDARASTDVNYIHCDVIQELSKSEFDSGLVRCLSAYKICPVNLSVSFGFMHHIPLPEWRTSLLQSLVGATAQGGYVVVSFWRFMDNESMAKKAQVTHEQAQEYLSNQGFLDAQDLAEFNEGDYLIGWQNTPGVYRYCHSFSDAEIDALVEDVANKADCVARFRADGRTGNLNEYLVLYVK